MWARRPVLAPARRSPSLVVGIVALAGVARHSTSRCERDQCLTRAAPSSAMATRSGRGATPSPWGGRDRVLPARRANRPVRRRGTASGWRPSGPPHGCPCTPSSRFSIAHAGPMIYGVLLVGSCYGRHGVGARRAPDTVGGPVRRWALAIVPSRDHRRHGGCGRDLMGPTVPVGVQVLDGDGDR